MKKIIVVIAMAVMLQLAVVSISLAAPPASGPYGNYNHYGRGYHSYDYGRYHHNYNYNRYNYRSNYHKNYYSKPVHYGNRYYNRYCYPNYKQTYYRSNYHFYNYAYW